MVIVLGEALEAPDTADRGAARAAAAGGGALYGLGILGALSYYWQPHWFWEYVWAIFPKAILWPAYLVYEGFRALGA